MSDRYYTTKDNQSSQVTMFLDHFDSDSGYAWNAVKDFYQTSPNSGAFLDIFEPKIVLDLDNAGHLYTKNVDLYVNINTDSKSFEEFIEHIYRYGYKQGVTDEHNNFSGSVG